MKRHFYLLSFLLLAACGGNQAQREQSASATEFAPEDQPLATTLVYDCNGYDFIARFGPGEVALWLTDKYLVLPSVRSASGALYEEGDVSLWSKGDEAMLTVGEQMYQNCQLQPQRVPWEDARRRGVDFRATGNEPGWHLEIQRGRQLLFVFDYGMQRVLVPDPAEASTGSTRSFSGMSNARELQVQIVDQVCVDTMSGESFPAQVVVTFENTRYEGCGQSLDYPWDP